MSHPSGNVRTLVLPGGGTLDIPLPGSRGQFAIRQSTALASSETCPRLVTTVLITLVLGAVIGVGATAWYLKR